MCWPQYKEKICLSIKGTARESVVQLLETVKVIGVIFCTS